MLSLLGFGKRRRRTSTKKSRRRKIPAKLMKLAKRYRVKTSVKRGRKRVMKSIASIKKAIAKKIRSLIKKAKRKAPARRRKTVRRPRVLRLKAAFGSSCGTNAVPMSAFGNRISFGGQSCSGSQFGARRPHKAVSKASAMAAFRKFYKQHCRSNVRRSRFGNGGNPMLSQSMGGEFCSGGGGVLGANSTGLFYSPCTDNAMGGPNAAASMADYNAAGAEGGMQMDETAAETAAAFGKRRRRRSSPVRRRRYSRVGNMTMFGTGTAPTQRPYIMSASAGRAAGINRINAGVNSVSFGKRSRRRSSPVRRRRYSRVGNMTMFGTGTAPTQRPYIMSASAGRAAGINRMNAGVNSVPCPNGRQRVNGMCFGSHTGRKRRSSPVRRRRA